MGLYQRRRPEPIRIFARQEKKNGEKSRNSPGSPDSPDSPKSPASSVSAASTASSASPKPSAFSTSVATRSSLAPSQASTTIAASVTSTTLPPPATTATPAPSSTPPPAPSTLAKSTSTPAPPPPPPPPPASTSTSSASTSQAPRSSSTKVAEVNSSASTSSASTSSRASSTSPATSSSSQPSTTTSGPIPQVSASSSISASTTAAISPSPTPTSSNFRKGKSTELPSAPTTTNTSLPDTIDRGPQRSDSQRMSPGIEATLITLSILGFLAVLICLFILYKRRQRRQQEFNMRHAEDAFSPNNNGSLHQPKAAHMSFAPRSAQEVTETSAAPQLNSHMTKSTTNTNSLFGAGRYNRPETVSTNTSAPLPTPNPFADPARNKAFDQIRGRPRSTTLTDRGSWVQNPFKDPLSNRFDPFGELQAKARAERIRYLENIRREQEEQFREKEAMGMGVPRKGSVGSGVTLEGVGVLDRAGGGYR